MANPQVLIVGAGPVGLTLALALHQSGLPAAQILVADQRLSRDENNDARALAMSASSLEVFRILGIAERFIHGGVPLPKAHFGGGTRLLDLNYEVLGTKYPFNYSIPQWKTESILLRRCEEVGITFAWGRRFISLDTESVEDNVVAVFENLHHNASPSSTQRIQVPWLVGCDSTRSAVRQAAGISMEGSKATHFSWGVDCTVDLDVPPMCTGTDGDGLGALFYTLGPGLARLGGGYPVSAGQRPEPPSEEYVRAWAMRSFGRDFGLRDFTWTTVIGDGMSVAETLRAGRVFLAGDAAHQLFPAGGQGMNTGLLDATNLAWKLALVATKRITDRAVVEHVLDSYTGERKSAIEAVVKNVRVQVSILFKQTEIEKDVADFIAEALDQPEFNKLYARRVTGFGDPTEPYRSSEAFGAQSADKLVGTRLTHISGTSESAVLQAASENIFLMTPIGDQGVGSVQALQIPTKHQGQYKTLSTALQPTDPKWDGVKAVLLRPDLRVAWVLREGNVSDMDAEALSSVLSWWFGPGEEAAAEFSQ